MSYRELEAQIREWANIAAFTRRKEEDAREKKAKKKLRAQLRRTRPALYIPDAPVKYLMTVTLSLRKVEVNGLGELVDLEFPVNTISEVEAELAARAQAKAAGYQWRGTVSVELAK